jgi:hypothetical protein
VEVIEVVARREGRRPDLVLRPSLPRRTGV